MTDQEVNSKGHESDDERSVSASNDSMHAKIDKSGTIGEGDETEHQSRKESKRSLASERDKGDDNNSNDTNDDDDDEKKKKDVQDAESEKHIKGGKAVAALRNDHLDKVVEEYKAQFPGAESTTDTTSAESLGQQDHSDETASNRHVPQPSSVNDMVIDEFKQRFSLAEDQHSDRYSVSNADDRRSENSPSEIIEKLFRTDDMEKTDNHTESEFRKSSILNEEEEETPVYSTSPKAYESGLNERKESDTNDLDELLFGGHKQNKTVPLESEQHITKGDLVEKEQIGNETVHPPQINVEFSGSPIEEYELDELDRQHYEQQKQAAHTIASYEIEKNDEQNEQTEESTKRKSIHEIAEQFGGSSPARWRSTESGASGKNAKFFKAKVGRPLPKVAAKYVKTVTAAKTGKPINDALEDDQLQENEPESDEQKGLEVNNEERFMSVRVVRNVRDFIKKQEDITKVDKKQQKLHGNNRPKLPQFNAHQKKDIGVQVQADQEDTSQKRKSSDYDATSPMDRRGSSSDSSQAEQSINMTSVSQRIKIYQNKASSVHSPKH